MQMPPLLASTLLILLFNLTCSLGVSSSTSPALGKWNYLDTLFPEGEQIQIDCDQPPCDNEDFDLTKITSFKTCYRCCPTQYVQICSTILRYCKCVAAQTLNNLRMKKKRKYDAERLVFHNVPVKTGFLKWSKNKDKNSKKKLKPVAHESDDVDSITKEESSAESKNKSKYTTSESGDSTSLTQEEESTEKPVKKKRSKFKLKPAPGESHSQAKDEDTTETPDKHKKKLYSFDYLGDNYWEVANLGLLPKTYHSKNIDHGLLT